MEFRNLDQDESIFFNRELEHIKAQSFDVLYQDLFARTILPTSDEAGAYARSITYRTFDQVGMAKIISSYAKDLPRADVSGFETTTPVRVIGLSFGFNVDEILASNKTGRSLEQRRANAVQRGTEETIDRLALFGDVPSGIPGFFSNPNIPAGLVADGGTGNTTWVTKTPQEILDDINSFMGTIFSVTLQKEKPNTLLLPTAQWSLISTTPRSDNSDMTILKYVVANSPYLSSEADVMAIPDLTGIGTVGGGDSADIMVAYDRNPDKLTMEVPLELTFLAPQERGLEIEVPSWAKSGGTIVYYPLSVRFAEGI